MASPVTVPPIHAPAIGGEPAKEKPTSKREVVYAVLSRALRDQLGEATFERILSVHKTAIAFREAHADEAAQRALKADLVRLLAVPLPQQLHVIRAFSYFSQLLNISEDVDEVRKLRSAAAVRLSLIADVAPASDAGKRLVSTIRAQPSPGPRLVGGTAAASSCVKRPSAKAADSASPCNTAAATATPCPAAFSSA